MLVASGVHRVQRHIICARVCHTPIPSTAARSRHIYWRDPADWISIQFSDHLGPEVSKQRLDARELGSLEDMSMQPNKRVNPTVTRRVMWSAFRHHGKSWSEA